MWSYIINYAVISGGQRVYIRLGWCPSIIIIIIKYHENTNIGACKVYTYRELEFTNTVNSHIEFRLLKAMNVSGTDFTNNLTTGSFVVIINSGVI